MGSLPEPARLDIYIDEPRVARGSIDRRSLRVDIEWRRSEHDPPIVAALAELPDPVDVEIVKRSDGSTELVPASWRTRRFGQGKPFFQVARERPGALGIGPLVGAATEYAAQLIRQYRPDLDDLAPNDQTELLATTIGHVNSVSNSIRDLEKHLKYAEPDRPAVPPLKDPGRAVHAAILKDVHGWTTVPIGKKLRIPPPKDVSYKRENQTVRAMIRDRGRPLLELFFGSAEWQAKAQRMCAEGKRWEAMLRGYDPRCLGCPRSRRPAPHLQDPETQGCCLS